MRAPLALALCSFLASAAADVAPSCGSCGARERRPPPPPVGAGAACGGPFGCAKGTCQIVDDAPGGRMVDHVCTTACDGDEACEAFAPGQGLTCAGFALPGAEAAVDAAPARVCVTREGLARARAAAPDGAPGAAP